MDTDEIASADKSTIVLNMESMIKTILSSISRAEEEMDKHKSMLDSILENDETYKEHSERAKEASKIKSGTRRQILKQPQAAELAAKVQSLKSQIKENKASLSDYLREFQKMSGINEIEDADGEVKQIVFTAKLVNKSSGF